MTINTPKHSYLLLLTIMITLSSTSRQSRTRRSEAEVNSAYVDAVTFQTFVQCWSPRRQSHANVLCVRATHTVVCLRQFHSTTDHLEQFCGVSGVFCHHADFLVVERDQEKLSWSFDRVMLLGLALISGMRHSIVGYHCVSGWCGM